MKSLRSYAAGAWHTADDGFVEIHDPCSEAAIARVSSAGVDFAALLEHGRTVGGPALRALSFAERAALLMEASKALHAHREELIDLSLENTGSTRKDGKFDVDGAIFTLSHYASLGSDRGDALAADGDDDKLGRSARLVGRHVYRPLRGCAVHVNAFNFPAWGLAEKAACAWLAGMPVISKPATSTALVTERCAEILIEAGILPEGALQLVCGSTGDLLDRLGAQDVLAFTGSARTALKLRGKSNLLEKSTRVNVEADSLNPATLGPDVEPGSELWDLFVRDVAREMTQKSGQKCTAVRRILVPRERLDAVQEALVDVLGDVVTGDPRDRSVTMGPLATRQQLDDAIAGVEKLAGEAKIVHGDGKRVEGVGGSAGKGYYFAPTLLRCDDASGAEVLHEHEVFAPVSTLMGYDGEVASAAELVGRGEGALVASLYSDDPGFVGGFVDAAGPYAGRIYIGSTKVAGQLGGSGLVMPHLLHGGPGRAGGGSELGGERGLHLYMQRVALQGDRTLMDRFAPATEAVVES